MIAQGNAPFSTRMERFGGEKLETPSATKYDVARSFDALQRRGGVAAAKAQASGKSKSTPFLSSTKRDTLPLAVDTTLPAPNNYNTSVGLSTRGGRLPDRANDRFRETVNDAPPPTAYLPAQDSVTRGTFNVTLNNPLKRSPRSTSDTYSRSAGQLGL